MPRRKRLSVSELLPELAALRAELARLRHDYQEAVDFAVDALPHSAQVEYSRHVGCETSEEIGQVLSTVTDLLMEASKLHPEPYPGARAITGERVACPVCTAEARGPYTTTHPGWGYPKGLDDHLRGKLQSGCGVMRILRRHAYAELEIRQKNRSR